MQGVALSRIIDEVYLPNWTPYSSEERAGLQHLKVQTVCALFLLVDSKAPLSQLNSDQN